jgi:Na+/H+-dicarboxylate symporter
MAYIIPIDSLLERLKTAVNFLGEGFGVGIVAKLSKADLEKIPLDVASTIECSGSSNGEEEDADSRDFTQKV